MPIHDWTRVPAGIFHHFHHRWITAISDALNAGLLPPEYYALAEQTAAGLGPDVLALQARTPESDGGSGGPVGSLTLARPQTTFTATTDAEFYRRKKSWVAVRHVSDDRVVAIVEIISPGNKTGRNALRSLLDKVWELLERRVHLLLIDLFPPTKRDPHGLHAAVWAELVDDSASVPSPDKPLTLVAYESDLTVTAYIEPITVGDVLPDMPLILEPAGRSGFRWRQRIKPRGRSHPRGGGACSRRRRPVDRLALNAPRQVIAGHADGQTAEQDDQHGRRPAPAIPHRLAVAGGGPRAKQAARAQERPLPLADQKPVPCANDDIRGEASPIKDFVVRPHLRKID
jgi:hypothetical protein